MTRRCDTRLPTSNVALGYYLAVQPTGAGEALHLKLRTLLVLVLVLCLPGAPALASTRQKASSAPAVIDHDLALQMQHAGKSRLLGIVEFAPNVRHRAALAAVHGANLDVITDFASVNAVYARGAATGFASIAKVGGVRRLEAPRAVEVDNSTAAWATRVRTMSDETGGLDLRLKDANGHVIDGTGVGIGIVDSGTDALHPDLSWCGSPTADQSTCKTKLNFKIKCPSITLGVDGECAMQDVPNSDTTSGHGTHVSGIAAGDGTASHGLYRGTAPGAKLYGFGAGDGDSIFTIDAAFAFQWILDNGAKQSPPIKVINNSYGGPGFYNANNPDLLSLLADKLIDSGVTVVWAAGNSGQSPCAPTGSTTADQPCTGPDANDPKPGNLSIANYDDGATGSRDRQLESDSSQGFAGRPDTNPDVAAPGSNIISACNLPSAACNNPAFGLPAPGYEPYYTHLSGTSMAAPHATGIVALLYQAHPGITPAEVEKMLKDTAHRFTAGAAYDESDPSDPDTPTSIDKGHGLIDARESVLRAMHLPEDTGLSGGTPTTVIAEGDTGDQSVDSLDLTSVKIHEVHGDEPSTVPNAPAGDRVEITWNVAGTTTKPSAAPYRYQLTGSVDGTLRRFSVDWSGTTASCTQDLADGCVAAATPTGFVASYDAAAFGAAKGAPFFDLVATAWGDIENAPDVVKTHCNGSNDILIGTLNTDMPTLCADDRAPGLDTTVPAAVSLTTAPLRGKAHIFTFTPGTAAGTCGPNAPEIVDPEGDATAFIVDAGVAPSDPSLDLREGRLTWDPSSRKVTFHIAVQHLSEAAPTGATGKLFRFNFDYAGTTYEVQAQSDDSTGAKSYTLDVPDATGQYNDVAGEADGMSGAFDTTTSEIRVVMPIALFDSSVAAFDQGQTPAVTPPPALDWGSTFTNLAINGQRVIHQEPYSGSITPTADSATGSCNYSIGQDIGVFPPKVTDDSATTRQGSSVTIAPLANDDPRDQGEFHVTEVTQGAHGTVTKNADDTVRYAPAADFYGTDSFTYTATNAHGLSSVGDVTVDVTPICPITPAGTFTDTLEPNPDPRWTFDTSADGGPANLTWGTISDSKAHSPTHSFFTDDATSIEQDDRLVSPPMDLTAQSHLVFWHRFVFEAPANDPTGTGIQENDGRFFDGGVLEISTDGGQHWQDVVAGGGRFVDGAYNGKMSDTALAIPGRDAWGGSSAADMTKVDVDLGAFAGARRLVRWRFVNDDTNAPSLDTPLADGWYVDDVSFTGQPVVSTCGPPVANDDTATTAFGHSVNVDVLANDTDPDNDPLTVSAYDAMSAHGGTIVKNADNTVTYTPTTGFTGDDTFNYVASDPTEQTSSAVVTVTVGPPDRAPDAIDDNANTSVDSPVTVPVLANDSDPDGDAISVTAFDVSSAHGGSIAKNDDGTLTYTPSAGYTGSDVFNYTISDPSGKTDSAAVTVDVAAAPPPNAFDDTARVKSGKSVTISVLDNDSDPMGFPMTIASADSRGVRGGKVVVNQNGTITYTAPKKAVKSDSFTYTITDPYGQTDTATVYVKITSPPKKR